MPFESTGFNWSYIEVCFKTFLVLKECLEVVNCPNLCVVDEVAPEDKWLAEGHAEYRVRQNANLGLQAQRQGN